jgi:hypothetical protein
MQAHTNTRNYGEGTPLQPGEGVDSSVLRLLGQSLS